MNINKVSITVTASLILLVSATRAFAMDPDLAQLYSFLTSWYNGLLLPLGAVLAGLVILIGGIMYATSAGDAARVQKAKEVIFGAISGLVLLICASLIIQTIVGT